MSKRKTRMRIAFVAVVLILALVVLFSGLRILESTVFYGDVTEPTYTRKTIERDGVGYFPRQDITVVLVMGIDEEGPVEDSGSYRNSGEVDMVSLLVLDHTNESYDILCLNRDTMVDMPVLGLGGKTAGTLYGQLALSHTYGSGLTDSAENTKTTVSDLLYGLHIDYYVALNMDAIGMLNDMVGGVTVHVTEDFSQVDPTITMGTVTLDREQAMTYVRSRKDVGTQLNLSRMERHTDYLQGLTAALTEKVRQSDSFAVRMYQELADYMVTDCSVNVVSSLLERCVEYELEEILTVPGENVRGEEYYEFYADPDRLQLLALELFYAPKES